MDRVLISVKLIQSQKLSKCAENATVMTVHINPAQNGGELRSEVARLSGQSPADIRLVFAGKLIDDVQTMEVGVNVNIDFSLKTLGLIATCKMY